jgi:uncharacterized protein
MPRQKSRKKQQPRIRARTDRLDAARVSRGAPARAKAPGSALALTRTPGSALVRKLSRLERIIARCDGALVAFSGGVDSTFLLSVAKDVLGAKLLAVTVSFPAVPQSEVEGAKGLARKLKVKHIIVRANEVAAMQHFRSNPPDRCYHCKKAIFSKLAAIAKKRGIPCILEASNKDDMRDYRPGHKAVRELGVRSPLVEAGLSKADIRALSRERGLVTWDKPSAACLASRIPYGETITREKLARIEEGEAFLNSIGFRACRLRHHGSLARIEVPEREIARLLRRAVRHKIVEKLKAFGFRYITFDLEGYRSGSMNEALPRKQRRGAR